MPPKHCTLVGWKDDRVVSLNAGQSLRLYRILQSMGLRGPEGVDTLLTYMENVAKEQNKEEAREWWHHLPEQDGLI